ncbi:phosphatidate phosphatase LPIN2 isoform X1 [Poecilia latipinna]|nr:PREDICTED: phosphatidate phosphatase LPIN2-like isoform X1 [Poecilia latipinna]
MAERRSGQPGWIEREHLHPSLWSQTMNIVGQLAETVFVTVKELYRGLNPATLTGGIDVIVVRQPDGSYQCSPFHVRFGKLGVLRSKEKIVDIEVNGESVDLHMKLGDNGEAFFVEEEENMEVPAHLCTSPIPLEVPEDTDVIAEGSGARKKRRRRRHVRYDTQQRDETNSSSEERDKEEQSTKDSDAAQRESPSSTLLLTSKSVYYSMSEEPDEELGATQDRDTHPLSDEELPENRADSPKIDSELLDEAPDLSEPQMQWNWGGFPTPCDPENAPGELKATSHFFPIERQDSFDLGDEVTPSEIIGCVKPQPTADSVCLDSSAQQTSSSSPKNFDDELSSHDVFMSCVSSTEVDSEFTVEEKEEKESSSEKIGTCFNKSQEGAEKVSSVAEGVSENGTLSKTEELIKKMAECTLQESGQDSGGPKDPQEESVSTEQRESDSPSSEQRELDSTPSAPDGGLVPSAGGEDDDTTLGATDESPESSAAATTAAQAADADTGSDVAKSSEASSKLEQQDEKKSKQIHPGGSSDIYLEDLNTLDPEVAELYFPKTEAEGALTQFAEQGLGSHSPQLVDIGAVDSGTEYLSDSSYVMDVSMSLCGKVGDTSQITKEKFTEHLVTYQDFINNPGIIEDPSLVICINSNYYNWGVAAPMILSVTAFQKNLPTSTVEKLVKDKMSKKPGRWWFSWRRREMDNNKQQQLKEEQLASVSSPVQATLDNTEAVGLRQKAPSLSSETMSMSFSHMYRKSLRLTSKEIDSLNLREGANKVVFSVTSQYQGTCRCEAAIYLWNWNDRVIISDIDGTITKSDALGHILPQFGKDWTHKGIAKLYHKIHKNGYKFLYCSARAIGMATITKDYLKWVNDQGTVLPKGPVLLAPSSLFSALHREVIEKKPEVFKIACLSDIRDLFGSHKQPFYAAFGNRTNDVFAYKKVGVSESKIFTVNPKGELIQEMNKGNKSSYNHLTGLVEHFFPVVSAETNNAAILVCPEYSSFSYWKDPLPELDMSILT